MITLRNTKGSPLTWTELDNNFIELDNNSKILMVELSEAQLYDLNNVQNVILSDDKNYLIEGVFIDNSDVTLVYSQPPLNTAFLILSTQLANSGDTISSENRIITLIPGANNFRPTVTSPASIVKSNVNYYLYWVSGSNVLVSPDAGNGSIKVYIKYRVL